jgi:hypothetical protein
VYLMAVAAPSHSASESELEAGQRSHDDRINVLRVKFRIADQLGIATAAIFLPLAAFQRIGVAVGAVLAGPEVCRLVQRSCRCVVVDHVDPEPARTLHELLGWNLNLGSQDLSANFDRRILRDNCELTRVGQVAKCLTKFTHGIAAP